MTGGVGAAAGAAAGAGAVQGVRSEQRTSQVSLVACSSSSLAAAAAASMVDVLVAEAKSTQAKLRWVVVERALVSFVEEGIDDARSPSLLRASSWIFDDRELEFELLVVPRDVV